MTAVPKNTLLAKELLLGSVIIVRLSMWPLTEPPIVTAAVLAVKVRFQLAANVRYDYTKMPLSAEPRLQAAHIEPATWDASVVGTPL